MRGGVVVGSVAPVWRVALAALLLALLALPVPGQTRTPARAPVETPGRVVHVVDGDTVRFVAATGGDATTVRLEGIDAPEICQSWGSEARDALRALVLERDVVLVVKGRDEHGRTLARLRRGDVDVGERLVRDGHAWSHRYKHDRGPFVAQERMARALGRGLHAAGGAENPRDFRRRHGPCHVAADVASLPAAPPARLASGAGAPAGAAPRRCDGRTRCSQMTSCDEATWFVRHCPGVQMDGDGDGVACERQWCSR